MMPEWIPGRGKGWKFFGIECERVFCWNGGRRIWPWFADWEDYYEIGFEKEVEIGVTRGRAKARANSIRATNT
jgi:hypothetical protein